MKLVANMQRIGLAIKIHQIFGKPTIRQLAMELPDMNAMHGLARKAATDEVLFDVVQAPDDPFAPFPLIGITRAYFVGLYMSDFTKGINPQMYFEWEWKGRIEVPRLQAALDAFIASHPTWRAVVTPDGMMRVLEYVPSYEVRVETPHPNASHDQILATRADMSEN
eukprot:6032707-Prymnesium_polylepis.1